MPNPNSFEYSNKAAKCFKVVDIFDDHQSFIGTSEQQIIAPKEAFTFQLITDQYRTVNAILNNEVVFTMSDNPDAQWNTSNSSFQYSADMSYIFDDIFNNFYNS